jgi:hypothetical protein
MKNTDELLKKILLNMKYDSSKNLDENKNSVREQLKPSVSVGDVETLGIVPTDIKIDNKVVSTTDYLGRPLVFNGIIHKTSKQFIDDMTNEVNSMGESSYREKPIEVTSIEYVGPDWGKNLFKSYRENKMSLDDLKQKVGSQNIKYGKKISGYEYKKNTLGYIATRCKSSLQKDLKKSAQEKGGRYSGENWYEEPNGTKDCVLSSIKNIGSKLSPNSVFSFWAINPKTNLKDWFYLGLSCGTEITKEQPVFYDQGGKEIKPSTENVEKIIIPSKCDSSTIRFSGYKTTDGKRWDLTKKDNVEYAKSILNKNTGLTTTNGEPKIGDSKTGLESGKMKGNKLGSENGVEGGDDTISLGMTL